MRLDADILLRLVLHVGLDLPVTKLFFSPGKYGYNIFSSPFPVPIFTEDVVSAFIISPFFGLPIIIYHKWNHIKILRRMRTVWISGNKHYAVLPAYYYSITLLTALFLYYATYYSKNPIYEFFLTVCDGTLIFIPTALYFTNIIVIIFPKISIFLALLIFTFVGLGYSLINFYPYHIAILVDAVAGQAGMPIRKLIGIRQTNYPTETIGFRDVFEPEKFPDPAAEPEHQPQSEPRSEPQTGSDQEPELGVEEGMGGSEGEFGGEDAEKAGAEGGGIAGSAGPVGTTERGSIERAGSSGGSRRLRGRSRRSSTPPAGQKCPAR
ncbi:MAG: hypothetical protein QXS54_01100 [Candidatus Methanomethylicaceae archaeon]